MELVSLNNNDDDDNNNNNNNDNNNNFSRLLQQSFYCSLFLQSDPGFFINTFISTIWEKNTTKISHVANLLHLKINQWKCHRWPKKAGSWAVNSVPHFFFLFFNLKNGFVEPFEVFALLCSRFFSSKPNSINSVSLVMAAHPSMTSTGIQQRTMKTKFIFRQ